MDLVDAPLASKVMADNGMKSVAAIAAVQSALAHDLLDVIDVVSGAAGIEAVAIDSCCRRRFGCCGLAALAPYKSPVNRPIYICQLLDSVEPIAGHGQDLWRAPKQLRGNRPAVDFECEFPVDRTGVVGGQAPDPAAVAGRRHLRIGLRGRCRGNSAPICRSSACLNAGNGRDLSR